MADVTRWEPLREMVELQEAMERLLQGFSRPWRMMSWYTGEGAFAVDLYETDAELVAKASIPGVQREDVQIAVSGNTLSIRCEMTAERAETRGRARRYSSFARSLALPALVDAARVDATFEGGVLTVRLPKLAQGAGGDAGVTGADEPHE